MFRSAVRAARPAVLAARSNAKHPSPTALRALHTTIRVSSDDHGASLPKIYGPGARPGTVPSDIEQSTGLERLQLLGELEGVKVFDDSPLDASRLGTKANPIQVPSYDTERIVGCTGSPADSHDVRWFPVTQEKQARCTECGSVYAIDLQVIDLEPTSVDQTQIQ